MADFPTINPVYTPSQKSDSPRSIFALGDGYQQSINFGLNSPKQEWSLEWTVEKEQAYEIDSFLQERADNAEVFNWRPPSENTTYIWTCDEWSVVQDSFNIFRITATFIRMYELPALELQAASATCVDMPGDNCLDLLCEDVTGPNIAGYPVVGATLSYSASCANAYIEWRIVDNLTGAYTIAAEGVNLTTYIATAASALAGKSLVAASKCPDPSEQDGYRCAILSPPLTIFNPYAYQYARAKFRIYYPLNPNSDPNAPFSNSVWINLSSYRYFLGEGNPYSNSTMSARQAAPWLINFSVYSVTVNGGGFTSAFGYLQNNGTYFGQFSTNESWTNRPINTLVTQISGYFEFSNNASTVLATWNGV